MFTFQTRRSLTKDGKIGAIKMFLEGASVAEVAAHYRVSAGVVHDVIREGFAQTVALLHKESA